MTEMLEEVERFKDLRTANLAATNLETFEDLTSAHLTAANLSTLKKVEDLTAAIPIAANLVLLIHTRGVVRRWAIVEKVFEGHEEADAEDVVKLEKVCEEVPSTR